MKIRSTSLLVTLLLLFSMFPSQKIDAREKKKKKKKKSHAELVILSWDRQLEGLDQMVRAGEFERTLEAGDRLVSTMLKTREQPSHPERQRLFGTAYMLRGLAAYGIGDERLAIWHWHVGLQIFPEIAEIDLTTYGEAGRFLMKNPLNGPLPPTIQSPLPLTPELERPRRINSTVAFPSIPAARRKSGFYKVQFKVIIDQSGVPHRFTAFNQNQVDTLLLAATAESYVQWRFEPATLNGEPVAIYFGGQTSFSVYSQ